MDGSGVECVPPPDKVVRLNAPMEEALLLQKPAPAGALKIVATDTKEDGAI